MFKVACVFVLVGVAIALPRPDSPPLYGPPAPSYPAPVHQNTYKDEPKKPYTFDYGVKDEYSGANYGHSENSDGNSVKGSYSVALPDGRVQTVNYIADHQNGFQAEVVYEGQAVYPDHKPSYQPAPKPSYQPAPQPSYQPAPQPYGPPTPYV